MSSVHEPPPPRRAPAGAPASASELLTRSDAELLQLIAAEAAGSAGVSHALAALYDRYVVTLLTLAERLLGSRSEAEDLVHDLFIEVWLRAPSYDPGRASVRTWLLLRLRSRALDRLKSAAWRLMSASAPLWGTQDADAHVRLAAALVSDPDRDLALRATQEAVRRAVRLLSADEQRLIDLVYVRGTPLSEVAGELAAPLGTVKSRLSRVLGKLRGALSPTSTEV